jgi:hypothetical protein
MRILIDTPIWSKAFRRRKVKSDDEKLVEIMIKHHLDKYKNV